MLIFTERYPQVYSILNSRNVAGRDLGSLGNRQGPTPGRGLVTDYVRMGRFLIVIVSSFGVFVLLPQLKILTSNPTTNCPPGVCGTRNIDVNTSTRGWKSPVLVAVSR